MSYYCDYENISYLTKEHIVHGLERKQDGVRIFSRNKDVYVIYFSKDPWKEENEYKFGLKCLIKTLVAKDMNSF